MEIQPPCIWNSCSRCSFCGLRTKRTRSRPGPQALNEARVALEAEAGSVLLTITIATRDGHGHSVGLAALVALPFVYRDPYHLHILVLPKNLVKPVPQEEEIALLKTRTSGATRTAAAANPIE